MGSINLKRKGRRRIAPMNDDTAYCADADTDANSSCILQPNMLSGK